MIITLPSDDWIVCFDYNIGRMLLWRAGFRLRRRGPDHLDVYLQPGQDQAAWKVCYVSGREVDAGLKPIRELAVDEGCFDGTVMPNGHIGTSWGGQELLAASDIAMMLVRRLKGDPIWFPKDSGCGRKRTDSEHWTSAMRVLSDHPDWQEQLGIKVVKSLGGS